MIRNSVSWGWQPAPSARVAQAAIAWGDAARALHAKLQQIPEDVQSRLYLTASGNALVVIGAYDDLPWVDGIAYAASCDASGLWLPTVAQPDVPLELVGLALQRRYVRQPLLLWPPSSVIPLDRQLPVTPQLLDRVASRWQSHNATT